MCKCMRLIDKMFSQYEALDEDNLEQKGPYFWKFIHSVQEI